MHNYFNYFSKVTNTKKKQLLLLIIRSERLSNAGPGQHLDGWLAALLRFLNSMNHISLFDSYTYP
jgi:hypothetical protein